MSDFLGMDPDEVRRVAGTCRGTAPRITDLHDHLASLVGGLDWHGADAEALRAQWDTDASGPLQDLAARLGERADDLDAQADQQDVTSSSQAPDAGPAENDSTLPQQPGGDMSYGYQHEDNPWIPNWLEDPVEDLASGIAQDVSDALGWGEDLVFDGAQWLGDQLGWDTSGIDQLRQDSDHLRGMVTDWATGERVPTIAELLSATAVTGGSAINVLSGLDGDQNLHLFDDRPGGIVEDVQTTDRPQNSPQDLADLIDGNSALRMPDEARLADGSLPNGQIGIQEVRSEHGGEPSYIVQIPPTEADIGKLHGWGEQGNSRDWAQNLRGMSGQNTAAMDDVRAALEAADVPPGSNIMLVGHSQGGIVASGLAADGTFNSGVGSDSGYNVTHVFSAGSPVQTRTPAAGGTEVVNVAHGPLEANLGPGGLTATGDPVPHLDLEGRQIDGRSFQAPNVHDVQLPGYEMPIQGASDLMPWMYENHDSVAGADGTGGYRDSIAAAQGTDPTLSALQNDLTGVYLGDGTYVAKETVVTVGRGPVE